ncbi:TPA: hypothetical protein DEO28_02045 [Candidatus Dependentiae bacterium]|nr:MAG: Type I phosphodiesterase / nucleotide pyrophosphatase superfamily [candidate division TM6 bacterium GW2011_GWE2_31_21]KKP53011.1 MAG: Type I phosphodiesterase / nucleotide pyrophosphatase superfamily [candidate division TM6 bacterium GW2011_GWF2_33_332]HBS47752.1 hypothetical protein [Candidatus Dependentiae bacterium]HBZ73272.1 hypothetical protein [Candidatus Dependentiae bacterium]
MLKVSKKIFLLSLIFIGNIFCQDYPNLTVVIVIDQLANHKVQQLLPFLKGGIKFLAENGIYYQDATYPYANTSTAPGHATLASGVTPKEHGIVANYWYDEKGKKIKSISDLSKKYPVFYRDEKNTKFKSAANIMVDNLSDQMIMQNSPFNKVFSLSMKDRAAIGMGGKLGKTIWFDSVVGKFTSSKAYFDELPAWLDAFNNKVFPVADYFWTLCYHKNSGAYNFDDIGNYAKVAQKPLIGQKIQFFDEAAKDESGHDAFLQSPKSDDVLLGLARECLNKEFENKPKTKFLLWISLSSLDKVGHIFGPDSFEYIDTIYQLDKQIFDFIQFVYSKVNPQKVLFVLTADHGTMSIVENLKKKGMNAERFDIKKIIENLNVEIEKEFAIKELVKDFKFPQFYLDESKLKDIDMEKRAKILSFIKSILRQHPAIKQCWTASEISSAYYPENSLESVYKNDLFPGRSGQVFCHIYPYMYIEKYDTGTGHTSPYAYSSQVPLVVFQKDKFEHKKVAKRVYVPQLANSLAQVLDVPKPSASTYKALPYFPGK